MTRTGSPEWRREEFTITTDRARLDRPLIHEFLSTSYWAKGIPRETVDRSIEGRCASACTTRTARSGSRA
jgi:hypothetical protein